MFKFFRISALLQSTWKIAKQTDSLTTTPKASRHSQLLELKQDSQDWHRSCLIYRMHYPLTRPTQYSYEPTKAMCPWSRRWSWVLLALRMLMEHLSSTCTETQTTPKTLRRWTWWQREDRQSDSTRISTRVVKYDYRCSEPGEETQQRTGIQESALFFRS